MMLVAHRKRLITALCSALLCTACRIGAPLVDEQEEGRGIGPIGCAQPPRCEPLSLAEQPERAAVPISLSECGAFDPCTAVLPRDVSGGAPAPELSCPRSVLTELPVRASCAALRFEARELGSEIVLDGPVWAHLNVEITTQKPVQITLDAASLESVFVHLVGPVVLRIAQAELLTDLRVAGSEDARGAPGLELARAHGERLIVGTSEQPFEGRVALRAAQLMFASLHATTLELESTGLSKSRVLTGALSAADVVLSEVTLDADSAVMSAFRVRKAGMHFCHSASLIEGSIQESAITSCADAAVRVYGVLLAGSAIDGSIEADTATFANVRIGANEPTRIISFASGFSSSTLCSQVELLALGHHSTAKCTECDEALSADQICALPVQPDPLGANYCHAMTEMPLPEPCSADFPTRSRPGEAGPSVNE